jgi:ribosomal-protein-serine acetyltransferase
MHPIMTNFPMPIVTPRLILRKPIMGYVDAHEYAKAVAESIDDLKPWLPWAQYSPTVNQAETYIQECYSNWITKDNNNIGLVLFIIDRKTSVFLGHMVMWNIIWEVPKLDIGFWVRSSHAQKGYITEATNALTRYCFSQLGVRRVEIHCDIKNKRSQLVPQRLGFKIVADDMSTEIVFFRIDLNGLPDLDVK